MTSTINYVMSDVERLTKPRTKRTAKALLLRGAKGKYARRCDNRFRADYQRFEPYERDCESYHSAWLRATTNHRPGSNYDYIDPHEFDDLDEEIELDQTNERFEKVYESRHGIPRNYTTESPGFTRNSRAQIDDQEIEEQEELHDNVYEGEDAFTCIDPDFDVMTISDLIYGDGDDDFESHLSYFEV